MRLNYKSLASVAANTQSRNTKASSASEIRRTMLQKFFTKEWIERQKILQILEQEKLKNKELQEQYNRLFLKRTKS